ncbi:MAG: hypothetical protein ACKVRP_06680 [Bacteroidota bacterium]
MYNTTRDGRFQYHVPTGWFDASGDSSNGQYLIWLVRDDYGATLGLQEVFLDDLTQREVKRKGLRAVAELSQALISQGSDHVVRKPLEEFTLQGMQCYSYEYTDRQPSDVVRVVGFEVGGSVYELTALIVGEGADSAVVFSVQQSVLSALRRPSL